MTMAVPIPPSSQPARAAALKEAAPGLAALQREAAGTQAADAPARAGCAAEAPGDPASPAQACAAQIIEAMPVVMAALRTSMRSQVADALSVPQFRCLNFIAGRRSTSVTEIARFVGVTTPTASATVDRLVRQGYVTARTSAHDRRRSSLELTRKGRALIDRTRRAARDDLAVSLADRESAELEAIGRALAALKDAFSHG